MLAVLVIGDIWLLQSVRPQNDQLETYTRYLSLTCFLNSHFQTGITLFHHWYQLLYYEEHCLCIYPFPSHGIPKLTCLLQYVMYQQHMSSQQSFNIKKEVIMKTAICCNFISLQIHHQYFHFYFTATTVSHNRTIDSSMIQLLKG